MTKSETSYDEPFKRGHKKKKRKFLRIFLIVLFVLIILLGAVGGKVYFDLKSAINKAYVSPPTETTSVSLKKQRSFYDSCPWNKRN